VLGGYRRFGANRGRHTAVGVVTEIVTSQSAGIRATIVRNGCAEITRTSVLSHDLQIEVDQALAGEWGQCRSEICLHYESVLLENAALIGFVFAKEAPNDAISNFHRVTRTLMEGGTGSPLRRLWSQSRRSRARPKSRFTAAS